MAADYAERARALVGTRFRPQGRSEEGLDCVGVILLTFGIDPARVRRDYRLRDGERGEIEAALAVEFWRVASRRRMPGDVLLMQPGGRQFHLGISTGRGFVHAHAGIGKVVETPSEPEWPLVGVYRRRLKLKQGL